MEKAQTGLESVIALITEPLRPAIIPEISDIDINGTFISLFKFDPLFSFIISWSFCNYNTVKNYLRDSELIFNIQ